jgi:alkylation response protein AidB-like acyl-CoA dehydrogenase
MSELDHRLVALRQQVREWAADLRPIALEIDRDPVAINDHLDLPAIRYLSTMVIPPEYGAPPMKVAGHRFYGMASLERAVVLEELACADAGTLLAAPGASMSGVLVDLLADEQQKEWFYGQLLERPQWTFFGLTEPNRGSDAGGLRTSLSADGLLTGEKRYVGNATRASLGVVFARTRPGPLGIVATLVRTSASGYTAVPIDTVGLRGARIGAITLDRVEIAPEHVLGSHLSAAQRGMWACVRTFNRLRPGVAAIALGIARAAYEYVLAERDRPGRDGRDRLDVLGRRIEATRRLIRSAATSVDANGGHGHLASAAKARACRLAEDATLEACELLGPGARLDHPMLDKLTRDARGVEFMEGTENMQKLNVFHGYLAGAFGR